MKKALNKINYNLYYYNDNDEKIEGPNEDMMGNGSAIKCNFAGLYDNYSLLYGDCTELRGNFNKCQITDEDREKGIHIKTLVNNFN